MDEERNSEVRDVNISAPEIGMTFINFDAVLNFYKHYAQEIGFAVVKRSTKMTDGKATYVIIACSRHGKMYRTVTNIRPRPSVAKTNCPARINVVINADSSCVISKITLEHNHTLSPYKSRFFSCNRVIDTSVKRRLDLNDRAGIRLNKSFNSIVVEAELKELLHCETSLLASTGSVYSYQVNEYGDGGKDVPFTVYFDEGTSLVSCICRLFEYKGILCRHSIAVLVHRKLMIVPNSYILTRWRKDVRRRYTRVKTWHKNLGSTAKIYRYEEVCRNMYDIADIAAESDEKCELALRTLRDLKTKLENTSSSKGSNDIEYSPIATTPSNDASNGRSNDQRVLSPLPVRSKGRPPSKRKESTTDKNLRGPDPDAHVRTLSAYHAKRTYGVRIVKLRTGPSLRIMQRGPTGSGS
ncbi:Protein FAR-RED ELONGATED HYPOCOTYL 3 [Ananas comosus]|uniref:Protein FAR1-RELATED SEQUENCE n=1 Tax=Ananas comosus TaxID=4615 RepID=A0A199VA77_ANACO|nr:Protein FAR-RED ELONGATED HYPOCOTYL 3 [Ananas comosus]